MDNSKGKTGKPGCLIARCRIVDSPGRLQPAPKIECREGASENREGFRILAGGATLGATPGTSHNRLSTPAGVLENRAIRHPCRGISINLNILPQLGSKGKKSRAKDAKMIGMREDEIARAVVDSALEVHKELGPGLLESVYEVLLSDALRERGFTVERQRPIAICFRGKHFDEGFRADLVVEGMVLVELKSVESLARVHRKQVLTYLKLSGLKLGLLINFGGELLKGNIERLVHKFDECATF